MPHLPELKSLARELRARGLDYSEISRRLGTPLPRSTLELWCADITPTVSMADSQEQAAEEQRKELAQLSLTLETENRLALQSTESTIREYRRLVTVLLLTSEAFDNDDGYITFSSSNKNVVVLFVRLIRRALQIDERKFRIQIHCRVGLDVEAIFNEWASIIDIPRSQFFKPLQNLKVDSSMCSVSYLSREVRQSLEKEAAELLSEIDQAIDTTAVLSENEA